MELDIRIIPFSFSTCSGVCENGNLSCSHRRSFLRNQYSPPAVPVIFAAVNQMRFATRATAGMQQSTYLQAQPAKKAFPGIRERPPGCGIYGMILLELVERRL